MITPVDVTGPIGGVRYETAGTTSLVCDCRLVVALDILAPELRSFGIKEVQHSGAYEYRTTRAGTRACTRWDSPSTCIASRWASTDSTCHATTRVGQGPSCEEGSPVLNRLACELDRTGLFEQVITPDGRW